MPLVRFEPTITTGERQQNYASDRAASGTGEYYYMTEYTVSVCICLFVAVSVNILLKYLFVPGYCAKNVLLDVSGYTLRSSSLPFPQQQFLKHCITMSNYSNALPYHITGFWSRYLGLP